MTQLSEFKTYFRDKVAPDWFKMSDDASNLAVWDMRFCEETNGEGLGVVDPIAYTQLIHGPSDMEAERFDELVSPTVRKSIVLEVLSYYEHTSKIAWKRACKRFLSEEVFRDVFPSE